MTLAFRVSLPSGVTVLVTNPEAQAGIRDQQDRDTEAILGHLSTQYTAGDESVKITREA
jgi:hypothetical protein